MTGKISAKGLVVSTNKFNRRFKMKTNGHTDDRWNLIAA